MRHPTFRCDVQKSNGRLRVGFLKPSLQIPRKTGSLKPSGLKPFPPSLCFVFMVEFMLGNCCVVMTVIEDFTLAFQSIKLGWWRRFFLGLLMSGWVFPHLGSVSPQKTYGVLLERQPFYLITNFLSLLVAKPDTLLRHGASTDPRIVQLTGTTSARSGKR